MSGELIEQEGNQTELGQSVVIQDNSHMRLIELAIEKGADIVHLEKLMDLQDRYEAKHARKAFFKAMAGFQSKLPEIQKNGKVNYENSNGSSTNFKHATLSDIGQALSPHLSEFGLSYRFEQAPRTDPKDQSITLYCIVSHELGHQEQTQMSGFADTSGKKNAIQAIASTRTYMQRYTLTDAFGLTFTEEDNDGAGGSKFSDNSDGTTEKLYDNELFEKNFPAWESKIKAGKKPDSIVEVLNKNGFTLSQDQLNKIYGVK